MISDEELAIRFTYHAPKPDQLPKFEAMRAAGKAFAQLIVQLTPESREQSLALTALDEVVAHANAAIARRG